jgi:hypothetical protein
VRGERLRVQGVVRVSGAGRPNFLLTADSTLHEKMSIDCIKSKVRMHNKKTSA